MIENKDCTLKKDVPKDLFTQEELEVDFATYTNMLLGISYEAAHREAVRDHKEYREGKNKR